MFLQDLLGSAAGQFPGPKPKAIFAACWRNLVFFAMGWGIGYACYPAAKLLADHRVAILALSLGLALASWLICVFVHEIGHAAAAKLVGWRVHTIAVGNFAFAPRAGAFFQVPNHGQNRDIGGWVLATPPPGQPWIQGQVCFTLGGVMANFLLAGLLMLATVILAGTGELLSSILHGLGLTSAIIAVANLVPLSKPGAWQNDGATLVRTLKGEVPPPHEQEITRFLGLTIDRIPVEEWDVAALKALLDVPSVDRNSLDPILLHYAFGMADLETAKFLLEGFLESNPSGPFEYRCMYAFTVAMVDRDGPRALRGLESLPKKQASRCFSYWQAMAAAMSLLEKKEEALEAVQNARRTARKFGQTPDQDDEEVFRAIEQGQDLPCLEPRARLGLSESALRKAG